MAISPLTYAIARSTPNPPSTDPPSLNSTASCVPVDAPAGAIARPLAPLSRKISASTVGRPRESQTRRPTMCSIRASGMGSSCQPISVDFARPGLANFCQAIGRARQQRSCDAAYRVLVPFLGQIFDGRLAVDTREKEPRKQLRCPSIDILTGLPIDTVKVSFAEFLEGRQELARRRGYPQAFEQHVIEAEGEIEGGIPEPGAFRIDEDRALRSNQNVLWAEIAVNQGQLGARCRFSELLQSRGPVRMSLRGSQQVRLKADRMENRVGRKLRRRGRGSRKFAVNPHQASADFGGGGRQHMACCSCAFHLSKDRGDR